MQSIVALLLSLVCSLALAGPREEALAVVEKWRVAYSTADVDTLVALHAPDALFFGAQSRQLVNQPLGIRKYYASLKVQPYTSKLDKMSVVTAADDAVVVTGTDWVLARRQGRDYVFAGRVTFVLAKRAPGWQIVHFHRSVMPR